MKALAAYTTELTSAYLGTLSSASGTGLTSIKTAQISNTGAPGQEQYVIDDAQSLSAGHVTAVATGLGTPSVSAVTVDQTVPVSNAWGTLAVNVAPPVVPNPPNTTSTMFTVNVTSGTFNTTNIVCIASQFHECAIPTAVSVAGSVATLTVPLRRPHASGALIMQGGAAGTGLELTANTVVNSGAGGTLRYLEDVFGSTGPNTLQVGTYNFGNVGGGQYGGMWLGSMNLGTISSAGTTVTATIANKATFASNGPYTTAIPQDFTEGSFIISGASDPALNAACSNLVFTTIATGTFTCTIAGLSGTHSSSSGSASLAFTSSSGAILADNLYTLWPMAEAWDVQDYTTNPIAVDGTFVLEPNIIPFVHGDTIEQTHNQSATYSTFSAGLNVSNPYTNLSGTTFNYQGPGIIGIPNQLGNCLCAPALASFINYNPGTMYQGSGGNLWPPNIFDIGGRGSPAAPYGEGMYATPGPLQNFIEIEPSASQQADANYTLSLLFAHGSGSGFLQFYTVPTTNAATLHSVNGTMNLTGDNGLTLKGSSVSLQGPVSSNSTFTAAGNISSTSGNISTSAGSITGNSISGNTMNAFQITAGTTITIAPLAGSAGDCLQIGAGGTLGPASTPCTPVNIPLRYVGTITTTTGTADSLSVAGLTTSNHCSAQPTNASAATLAEWVSVASGSVSLNHSVGTAGTTFAVFCNLL